MSYWSRQNLALNLEFLPYLIAFYEDIISVLAEHEFKVKDFTFKTLKLEIFSAFIIFIVKILCYSMI